MLKPKFFAETGTIGQLQVGQTQIQQDFHGAAVRHTSVEQHGDVKMNRPIGKMTLSRAYLLFVKSQEKRVNTRTSVTRLKRLLKIADPESWATRVILRQLRKNYPDYVIKDCSNGTANIRQNHKAYESHQF